MSLLSFTHWIPAVSAQAGSSPAAGPTAHLILGQEQIRVAILCIGADLPCLTGREQGWGWFLSDAPDYKPQRSRGLGLSLKGRPGSIVASSPLSAGH